MLPFYDVYNTTYLVTFFIFALAETLLCSGITYGWASIVVVFKEKSFYMDLCQEWIKTHNSTRHVSTFRTNRAIVKGGAAYVDDGTLPGCPDQDKRLNLIFTVALFTLCGIKFPAGVFIDRYGPRTARAVGGVLYVLACIGLGFVSMGYENVMFIIFPLIGMSGSLLVVAVYQVANVVYRKSRSRVICILHGAFDSSAVMMLIFKVSYEAGLPFNKVMSIYSIICAVLIILGSAFLIPPMKTLMHWVQEENEIGERSNRQAFLLSGPDFALTSTMSNMSYSRVSLRKQRNGQVTAETDPLLSKSKTYSIAENEEIKEMEIIDDPVESCFSPLLDYFNVEKDSILHSVFSPMYIFELVYLLTFQLKIWYFVGSLPDYLERLALNDKQVVSKYINLFGYIQFGGILVTPLIGLMFNRNRLTAVQQAFLTPTELRIRRLRECIFPFVITNLLCLVLCVTSMMEDLNYQVPSYILYTAVRGFLYGNHGAFMGCAFPPEHFGTLYGLGIFVGGSFGLLQYPLFAFTSGTLQGNPFWTNIILFVLVLIGNIHPAYLWWFVRRESKRIKHDKLRMPPKKQKI